MSRQSRPRFTGPGQRTRLAARPSALLLALVRRARWLWLGWLEAKWAAAWSELRQWRARRSAARIDRPMLEALEPKLLLSAELMPLDQAALVVVERQIDVPAAQTAITAVPTVHPLAVNVTAVAPTVTLTGPGTGQVVADGAGYILQLTGTSSATNVSLVHADSSPVALTGISANGAVGALNLGNADLTGNATFLSSVGSLTLGQVNQASISVAAGTEFSFKAGTVTDTKLAARTANLSVNVTAWASSTAGASRIDAAGLKSLVTTGNLGCDVFLSGLASGYTLTTVQVGGTLAGGLWSVHGRASSITAGSTAAAWRLNISSTLVQLVIKADASGDLALAGLQLLQVGGSARGLHLLVGADLGDDAALGGSGANADTFKAGTLARVRITGDMVDSQFYVSVDPVNGVLGDGDDLQLGTPVQRLQELIVGGALLGSSSVIAPLFPTTVRVGGRDLDPATLPQLAKLPPDRTAPVLASFGLAPASDTGALGDNTTTANPVTLVGQTEAGALITLRASGSSTVLASTTAAANGSFSLAGIALALGSNSFTLRVADAAGNATTASLTVVREAVVVVDTTAPALAAALQSDTGSGAADGITNNPAITGTVTDAVGVTVLQAALDPSAGSGFTSILASVGAGGAFSLNRAQLDSLAGGALGQGAHTLRLVAKDAAGNTSTVDVAFTLDSQAPAVASFGLATASDTGTVGDQTTTADPVTLQGLTETGAVLTLRAAGSATVLGTATAAGDGSFSFAGVTLVLGNNSFELTATDAAGNSTQSALTVVREAPVVVDATPPALAAALQADTGSGVGDGITNNPAITGTVTDAVGVTVLQAALDPSAGTTFTNILASVSAVGAFSLSRAQLDSLAGGSLAQGAHTLRLVAKDAAGNTSTVDVAFTLDTQAPAVASFGLATASDTGTVGDQTTTSNPVTLQGQAETGAVLTLRAAGSATVLGSTTAAADGSFSFAGVALALGNNSFALTATDAAGNNTQATLSVVREASTGADTTAPVLTAALQTDSGLLRTDGITNDPTITGTAIDDTGVTTLLAVLDPGANPTFSNISAQLAANGSFTLTRAVLDSLAGGSLADGNHTLRLMARDAAGNASAPLDISFKLDSQAPSGASFGIASTDALGGDDSKTSSTIVALRGSAEAGATITLVAQGLSSTVGGTGAFLLPGVALASGDNSITLKITDAAGNSQTVTRTLSRVAATQSDAVLDWISVALKAIQLDVTNPTVATRVLAVQSIAVYDALAAIQGTPAFLVQRTVTGAVDAQAAAAQAAFRVLSSLYPAQRAKFDAALTTSLAGIADGAAKTAGIALGDSIARAVIDIRATDGYLNFVADDGSTAIGQWRTTGPLFAVAQDPQWAQMQPFALTSADEFRAAAPPALDSAQYAADLNQVESLGSATGSTRTADQTQQAHFWADGGGSYTPPGHWDLIATQVAAAQGNSISANARLMAQLNVALADAAIAAWDTKYTYDVWRPVTAIQNADLDGNAATTVDANWTPLLITPPHPSYVSGHSTFSAAAAGILAATFGDNTAFATTSPTLPNVVRSFTSFSQAADEAGLSRIYGGIHTMSDNQAGKTLGEHVAQAVLAKFALTQDVQAPKVVLTPTPVAVNTNLTITGQVLDNLSGVASAAIRIDGGPARSLTLDATGHFSFSTSLALDGTADFEHTYSITATDAAGNVSTATAGSFLLDTVGPLLSVSTLSNGDVLSGASLLGGIALGTGSSITQLIYSFDGGSARALSFDAGTGSFGTALDFGSLGVGSHTLTLTARDAAGNVTTLTRALTVDALAPFTLVSLTPVDGSGDVGVTQRPLVVFSRAVNASTLNSNTFYATGPDGSKLAATIVASDDGTYAWLFFANPMPGAARITVHVNGAQIRAAADGAFLDADADTVAGGAAEVSFTTVGQLSVSGTKLTGRVVDPGLDLLPMTFDDIRRGPDGVIHTADDVFLLPVAHAKVYILGQESNFVYTDANGYFTLDNIPAGVVKVAVDGRTATNAPADVFFPEMVMSAELLAGQTNTMMGSMGTTAERVANASRTEVYLPRIATSSLQAVSATQETVITAALPSAAPQLTDLQRQSLTLTVMPGTALDDKGQVLSNVQVGIATVPAALVKDMLPPGVLQHTFDITIQAPGVAVFTEPLKITFPNVFNAAAGTKLNILSFDHTTGMLVIDGTGTVSADGLTVVSDEGSGVRAPGWHGVTPPGTPTDGPDNPPPQNPPPCINSSNAFDIVIDLTTAAAACVAELVGVADGIKAALTIADKIRDTVSQVQTLIDNSSKPGVSAAELAAGFKIVGNTKAVIVTAVEFFKGQASPISKALKISKCLEAILSGLDNICGRIQSQGDACNTLVIKTVCLGIAVVKASLGKVNALIGAADAAIAKLGLTLVCALIDQLGTLIGAAANAGSGGTHGGASPLALQSKSAVASAQGGNTTDTVYDDIRTVGLAINAEFNGMLPDFDKIQAFAVGYDALNKDTDALDQDTAKLYSANVAGLPANAYYVIRSAGVELRGRSDSNGKLDVFLPPDADYTLLMYDPVTSRVAQVRGHSAVTGLATKIPALAFASLTLSSLPLDENGMRVVPSFMLPDSQGRLLDTDADGLPDIAEDIVGTRVDRSDSDTDGINDLAEVQQGLNPLDGRAVATGVVSQVALQGNTLSVAVVGSLDGLSRNTVLAATGDYGLAVIDAARITQPKLLAELNLPGYSQDVAADASRGLAAVAAGDAGLHIVNIANLAAPTLVQTVAFSAPVTRVDVRDGLAYVAVGPNLAIVDLSSGEVRATFDLGALGGSTLLDIALEGSNLYSVDAAHTLRAFSVAGDSFVARGTLGLPAGGGKLFVGNGVAYIGAGNGGTGGYVTADVSNPSALTLLSGVDNTGEAGTAIALTGSGLGVVVGNSTFGLGAFKALDVVSTTDPTNTGAFLTRYNLPAVPTDVALANGLAFVADGTGGVQIVNYTGYDSKGIAPTLSIAVEAVDADPATAGVQVLEGRTLRIVPTVSDDVQVRNVELLVNGVVVANDLAFPFELFAAIPSIAAGGRSVTVQVRATDTGGNVGLSNLVTLNVVPDTFAPVVVSTNVAEGERRFLVRSFEVVFDEPIDTTLLTPTLVSLVRAGVDGTFGTADDVASTFTVNARAFGQKFSVVPDGYLPAGDYELRISKAMIADRVGNVLGADIVRHFTIRPASDVRAASGIPEAVTAPSANPGQQIGIAVPFNPATAKATFKVVDGNGTITSVTVNVFRTDTARGIAYFNVPLNAVTGDVVVFSQVGAVITNFADGTFPLQILPTIVDIQVESVSADGSSAQVLILGSGFVEGGNSEYRFGSSTVLDAGTGTGPDVFDRYDPAQGVYISNGYARVVVPLSNGVFGGINVKTAGGTSASFSVSLGAVSTVALSGTAADAAQASANAGQAITLVGTGLSTGTDVLLRYTNINGVLQMVSLSPTAAAADGTSATLVLPIYVNGAYSLQVFGSGSQPLLQIVPTISSIDIQDRTVLYGSGYVEGGSTYNFAGASVTDTPADANTIDVYYDSVEQNRSAYLNRSALPTHGLGNVSVTTAGGTSAAFALNTVRVDVAGTNLGDVAVDGAGKLWVGDQANPGHLLKIDPATGQVVQTITMTGDYGTPYAFNYLGLQVLSAAMTLGATNVPAGSLLVFNGYPNADRVIAVNATTGAVIASLTLDGNYDTIGATFSAANGHIYLTENNGPGNRIIEVSAATGAQVGVITAPFSIQTNSGLAIDPTTGHLWLGSANGGAQLVEYLIGAAGVLTELRRIDTRSQNINQGEISGLSFAADGTLWVASTQGEIYRITTAVDPVAVLSATLSQINASAGAGVAANAGLPAANVGQVIELVGTNFGAGTRVLFNIRDNAGNTRVVSQTPLAINAAGTRLQVQVPDAATTADVRVVNLGATNLGFNSHPDAVYRNVTLSFTASGASSVINFSDGGLQSLDDESWGIDNVVVKRGTTTVFADNFESGTANAAWSDSTVNADAVATFSRFSGRFNNASQRLNLSGLTAGQTYTLTFDLLVLDSWDGNNPSAGPDLIDVSVDGVSKLRETLTNSADVNSAQTLRASSGIRLQVVPTLSGIDSGRPGEDGLFNLQGSGFMEGASTITIGGVALGDAATNLYPFDVTGARNNTINVVAPRTLDGPIRITTEGGYAEISGASFAAQPTSVFSAIAASAAGGVAANAAAASAITGQTIVLQGQGLSNSTLVQFLGVDDSGAVGTLTRTGSASSDGKTLSVVVPALARTGLVSVLGSGASVQLQIVPTLRAVGGVVTAGNTLVLEGTGLTANDLAITIDGRGVGSFSVRTIFDGSGASSDQQLLTLTVPAGVSAGLIVVSTSGGSSTLRTGSTAITALADLNPAADVGDTLATALNPALGLNQSVKISGSLPTTDNKDVDLYQLNVNAGDQLSFNMSNSASLYAIFRIFDAAGVQVATKSPYFSPGAANTPLQWTAPSSGVFYVGVSGYSNTSYDPNTTKSGNASSYFGTYSLSVERFAAGTSHLSGLSAVATSGTAAQATLAGANTGQSITVAGSGLLASDRLVFTTLDDNGSLSEVAVTSTVDVASQTISAVVPTNATTGRVRLERDNSGLLLQIVPTLSDVNMSGSTYTGGTLVLSGSGFAEGASSVWLGAQQVGDLSRNYGLDVYSTANRINLVVPVGAATGPIRVTTVGGTSATFGVSLSGLTASPNSGTPANAGTAAANPGQTITLLGSGLDATTDVVFQTIDGAGNLGEQVVHPSSVNVSSTQVQVVVPLNAVTGSVRVVGAATAVTLQILPTIVDIQVESVSADGSSAQVLILGSGFVEGGNSEYRFGSSTVLDAGTGTGPDVFDRYDPAQGVYISNGYARVVVPLSNGVFGGINVKTAGGTSASFSVSLGAVSTVALSGTAADAAQASANAGQAITLVGTGLSTGTDVLLRYTNINGVLQMVSLSPTAAAADGTSATLVLPIYVNGAYSLQVFGSGSQPLLQIVPTISSIDIQDRTVLYGSGYVEGGSTYNFAGASVTDTPADANTIDVYYDSVEQNRSAYLNRSALPTHGLGNVSVTTAGGTSAAFALNTVRVDVAGTNLGDVAVDGAGKLWVGDQANPGHLLKIDPATGQVVQTITMTGDYGTPYAFNYLGLQVLSAAMTLGATNVPAGSLLVFNGYPNADRVIAVNATTGAVIASLTLDGNYDTIGATFSAANGHIYLTENNGPGNRIIEVSAATGAQVGVITAPFSIQTNSGLAIDPTTGHLWLGSANGGAQLVEYLIGAAGVLTELRRIDTRSQNINQGEISGLSFAADGTLWVASTQGEVYRITTAVDPVAVLSATLSQINASAGAGVAANAGLPAANVGQVIELVGTNFGAATRVLFNIRDNAGNTRVVSQTPLAINAAGTRLQVQVPDAATTADVRVVNLGASNLGFNSYADAVYRNVTLSFTASGASSVINFSDGGLQSLDDESWGIDNVVVKRGTTTVFADNFESGTANGAWSDSTVNADAVATFSRFSGRFNNASQRLNLSGLTAGQTYTLTFDLLVLDSWDGNNPTAGPDLIDVSVDGVSKLRETLTNSADVNSAQTLRASSGIRLQVVPTLSGIDSGRPGEDGLFNLQGSGFMEGASTITIGGVALGDAATNLYPFDVTGARNNTINVVAPRTLDGPIRITTEGGYAEISGASFAAQPTSVFSAIAASAAGGVAANAAAASAITGQTIVLQGQGLSNSTLVQFLGVDDSGAVGTLTRTGSASSDGKTLSVVVPALARTGLVSVLGSGASVQLQIVPTLRAVGGVVTAGNTLVLEGTGLTANDLAITIDGRGVGSFSVRTIFDGSGASSDQQLLTLTVPAGVSAGLIVVSTSGGSSTLRTGSTAITALADLNPAADVGDTLATALNPALGLNQSVKISGSLPTTDNKDVDLYQLNVNAGDQLSFNMSNSASLYAIFRIFDAAGVQVATKSPYFSPGAANTPLQWTAPSSGVFYVGVSGYSNTSYDPNTTKSGNASSYFGTYSLSVERFAAGTSHLSGLSAVATSGTAAQATLAGANTGQSITVAGSGLLASDRLVFTTLDDNGSLSEVAVTSTVDVASQTISAVVPTNATTGRVRLERDNSGLLLQIVPTLSDVNMSGSTYTGGTLVLSGSGFAEGASSVWLGAQQVGDLSRNYGLDVYSTANRINLVVPVGAATGPIRVTTVGGTSATFGVSLSGLTASPNSGTPANAGTAAANPGQTITLLGSGLDATTDVVFQTIDGAGNLGEQVVHPSSVNVSSTQVQVVVPLNAVTGSVRVVGAATAVTLQILPTIVDIQVESVSADGSSAQVLILGSGFVEGGNSEYRFGSSTVLDAGTGTGPDVFDRYDPAQGVYISNGYARVVVPLSNGVFGGINVKTAGGTSASFSVNLGAVSTVALSGTAADAAQASANAGQAITLVGTGLSTGTDVLLRYTNINGVLQMVSLSPTAAAADGTSATLVLPIYVNGAYSLQVFGSGSQPLLQIVPTISSIDIQDRTVLYGSGYVEGGSTYNFAGASVTDTPADAGTIEVYYDSVEQNRSAYLNRSALPTHGLGNVSVTTAGGTSAAFALNTVRVDVAGTNLGDVAVDGAGKLWVGDQANPGHLLKIDPATGQVVQTITMTGDYGTPYAFNYLGLQVLSAAMTLGATNVPAGSLLVFNGYPNADRVIAVNATTGAVIASLTLDGNYDTIGATFSAANGHIYLTENNGPGNRIIEVSAATGAQVGVITAPFSIQTNSGLAIDPTTGHLWLGSANGGAQLVEYLIGAAGVLTELRRIDTRSQNINQGEISGLSFAADGTLWVASTQGEIYRIVV